MTLFTDVISSFNEKLFQGNYHALLSTSMFGMYPIYKSPEISHHCLIPNTKHRVLGTDFSDVILTPWLQVNLWVSCLSPTFLT